MKTKQLIGILCSIFFIGHSAVAQNSLEGYEWLEGKWTDGERTFVVTPNKIEVHQGGKVINETFFSIDKEMIETNWQNEGFEDGLMAIQYTKTLAYEGGDHMKRDTTSSLANGYEWLEGEWYKKDADESWAKVIITKNDFKVVNSNWNESPDEIKKEVASPYLIGEKVNYITGTTVLAIGNYIYVDKQNKKVVAILGEYQELELDKVK